MSVSNGDAHAVPSAFNGHEMTGITKSKRLNIVSVTIEARKKYRNTWFHNMKNAINDFTENAILFIMKDEAAAG